MRARAFLAGLLRAYKRWVSPALPPACRFHPSCSEYAAEAFETHGVLRGAALASWRVLRCNPWCRGGFDPVPESLPRLSRTEAPAGDRRS